MVRPSDDLSRYKVVFAPHLFILADAAARRMSDYVRDGGILVADCRTAVKDGTGLVHARILPGLLSDALGISIDEYEALYEGMRYALACKPPFSAKHTGSMFADWVRPRGAEVLAGFDEWHLRPYAAATRNRFGKGFGYYVATIVDEESFYDELVADLVQRAGLTPAATAPRGVEAVIREGRGGKVLFLINHTEERQVVNVPAGKRELLTGGLTGATVTLEPYGVAVIRL